MAQAATSEALTFAATIPRLLGCLLALMPLLLVEGCASWQRRLPILPEVTHSSTAARLLVPPNRNTDPPDTPRATLGTPYPASLEPSARHSPEPESETFTLADAIAFALQNSPRLRSARAAIERARGQEQVAFAPFLPQIDLLAQYGVVSSSLAPGTAGNVGVIVATGTGTRSYAEAEVGLQWTLYDFGRTGGRYRQAIARERIAELQHIRARQTVEFDVASAYLDVLLARAAQRVQEDAVRRAQAILDDTLARQKGGVALKEDVLRAQVQLAESREALVVARELQFNAVARLNNAMGRQAELPLDVLDVKAEPPLPGALAALLEQAAAERAEIGLARELGAAAQEGRNAAQAEFLPRVFVRASVGHTDGQNILTGWQEGAGLHLETPLYAGGRHLGELRSAGAEVEAAAADAQIILDTISLQVNLAYRAAVAARERIDLARPAVAQATENLRLVEVRYRNGNATPTEIVDSQAALTRAQQHYYSAAYTYLASLARLEYAIGRHQTAFPPDSKTADQEVLPLPQQLPQAN
jgi:outer membrane protein TolC